MLSPSPQLFKQMLRDHDFLAAADLGLINGLITDAKFGHCPNCQAVITDAWELGATIPEYVFPLITGEQIVIDQVDPSDDGKDITVDGLNVAGFEQSQTVVASSLADVVVPGTWRAVNRGYNQDNVKFAALITISNIGGTEIFAAISPDDQQTSQAIYMAPINRVTLIRNFSNAVNRTGGPTLDAIKRLAIELPNGVFRTQIRYGLQREGVSNISSDLIVGIALPPLTRIKISTEPSNVDTDISAEWSMHQYDTDALGLEAVNGIYSRWQQPTISQLPQAA